MADRYEYVTSLKSARSDELINTYLLRPIAGLLVRVLHRTPVTPNQVTLASIAAGLLAAFLYLDGQGSIIAAGLMVTLKDLLDSADGQLARARNQYSRRGRFLDSIGDFVVDLAIFSAIGLSLQEEKGDFSPLALSFLALAGLTLRVSFHVYYHVSYLHLEGKYRHNRILEEITEEDRRGNPMDLLLQRIFLVLYGWQDRLIASIDHWCRRGRMDENFRQKWYGDIPALRLSGLLGFGTELFVVTLFSVLNSIESYLVFNLTVMNGIALAAVGYRRWVLFRRITSNDPS